MEGVVRDVRAHREDLTFAGITGPDARNSRRFQRIEAQFPVRVVEASGTAWISEAVNLGPNGIKIADTRIRPPALVRLELELPAGGPLGLTAVAVRMDPDGVAFAFVNLARADFDRIRHTVDSLYLRRKLWIMIVEDEPEVAAVLADFCEEHDGATVVVPSAEAALAYLAQDQPDAILLDLGLPGMSGLQFLEVSARRQQRIPVVVVTGAAEADVVASMNLGALDFVRKPVDLQHFRLALDMVELTSINRRLERVGLASELDPVFRL
jgi:CheY-like chemotaxis protein